MPRDVVEAEDQALLDDPVLYILKYGRALIRCAWAGHQPGDARTTWCAAQAVTDLRVNPRDSTMASVLLARQLPTPDWNIADYNDDPKTTKADIVALFDRAILARRAGC